MDIYKLLYANYWRKVLRNRGASILHVAAIIKPLMNSSLVPCQIDAIRDACSIHHQDHPYKDIFYALHIDVCSIHISSPSSYVSLKAVLSYWIWASVVGYRLTSFKRSRLNIHTRSRYGRYRIAMRLLSMSVV